MNDKKYNKNDGNNRKPTSSTTTPQRRQKHNNNSTAMNCNDLNLQETAPQAIEILRGDVPPAPATLDEAAAGRCRMLEADAGCYRLYMLLQAARG